MMKPILRLRSYASGREGGDSSRVIAHLYCGGQRVGVSDVSDGLPSIEGLPYVVLHALSASHSEDTLNLQLWDCRSSPRLDVAVDGWR